MRLPTKWDNFLLKRGQGSERMTRDYNTEYLLRIYHAVAAAKHSKSPVSVKLVDVIISLKLHLRAGGWFDPVAKTFFGLKNKRGSASSSRRYWNRSISSYRRVRTRGGQQNKSLPNSWWSVCIYVCMYVAVLYSAARMCGFVFLSRVLLFFEFEEYWIILCSRWNWNINI